MKRMLGWACLPGAGVAEIVGAVSAPLSKGHKNATASAAIILKKECRGRGVNIEEAPFTHISRARAINRSRRDYPGCTGLCVEARRDRQMTFLVRADLRLGRF